MIVYQSTKDHFVEDVFNNCIEDKIYHFFQEKIGHKTNEAEIRSWKNSMQYMYKILNDATIPSDAGITIEYQIPQTSKRIDFIISGQDKNNDDNVVLIELKQWETAELTDKDGLVRSYVGKGIRELSHPSYQVWSYTSLLQGFNETVYRENVKLHPCAYLHNYKDNNVINNPYYKKYTDKAPAFLKNDARKLQNFIKEFIKYGDKSNVVLRIDNGTIRPSKNLADNLASMLKGNQEFIMIDDQKVVYENALNLAKKANKTDEKQVLIVEGGPGTGKSVVAINLLVELTKKEILSKYVTKNSAPRTVYEQKLKGSFRKTEISNFFSSSGSFMNTENNAYGALIVDEAHRLNEKSGLFSKGENQIKEIIFSSKFSIFFIDENQRIHMKDIGRKEEINEWAKKLNAKVTNLELNSQFRCNGSNGYLAWLDHSLQIRDTANTSLEDIDYDFRVFDNPNDMRELVIDKNKINNKARLVAGYCWKWISKKPETKDEMDIVIPEHNFAMQWNLGSDGQAWIIQPTSINQIGCIHTCQGLEVDYIGVIIGDDFIIRNGEVITDAYNRASTDKSISGFKKMMKQDPDYTREFTDQIIKNTYRTLMTRGMKGCYIYCTDAETNQYFRNAMKQYKE